MCQIVSKSVNRLRRY